MSLNSGLSYPPRFEGSTVAATEKTFDQAYPNYHFNPDIRWLPFQLCSTHALEFLTDDEQRLLNHTHARRFLYVRTCLDEILGQRNTPTNTDRKWPAQAWPEIALHEPLTPSFPQQTEIESSLRAATRSLGAWGQLMANLHHCFAKQAHFKSSLKKSHPYSGSIKDLLFFRWKADAPKTKRLVTRAMEFLPTPWQPIDPHEYASLKLFFECYKAWLSLLAKADTDHYLDYLGLSLSGQQIQSLRKSWERSYLSNHLEAPCFMTAFHGHLNAHLSRKQWASLTPLHAPSTHPQNKKGSSVSTGAPMTRLA